MREGGREGGMERERETEREIEREVSKHGLSNIVTSEKRCQQHWGLGFRV